MDVSRGPNYEIRNIPAPHGEPKGEASWLSCEVWARPDISRVSGAQLAETMAETIERRCVGCDGVVLDFRRATAVWGPTTERAIARMMRAAERSCLPLVVLHADEAIQQIALRKLIQEHAPSKGTLHESIEHYRAQRRANPRVW
jgi:hypothetical protein